ncbi:MAG: hypothetical protein N2319_07680 [Candidatus Kapabacteria bacterium]|nr:hypothetical protein [Candidatus Kapabacteria bacterium]
MSLQILSIINPTVNRRVDGIGVDEIRIYNLIGDCVLSSYYIGTHPLIPSQEGNMDWCLAEAEW